MTHRPVQRWPSIPNSLPVSHYRPTPQKIRCRNINNTLWPRARSGSWLRGWYATSNETGDGSGNAPKCIFGLSPPQAEGQMPLHRRPISRLAERFSVDNSANFPKKKLNTALARAASVTDDIWMGSSKGHLPWRQVAQKSMCLLFKQFRACMATHWPPMPWRSFTRPDKTVANARQLRPRGTTARSQGPPPRPWASQAAHDVAQRSLLHVLILGLPGDADFLRSRIDGQARLALIALRMPQPATHGITEDASRNGIGYPVLTSGNTAG